MYIYWQILVAVYKSFKNPNWQYNREIKLYKCWAGLKFHLGLVQVHGEQLLVGFGGVLLLGLVLVHGDQLLVRVGGVLWLGRLVGRALGPGAGLGVALGGLLELHGGSVCCRVFYTNYTLGGFVEVDYLGGMDRERLG